MYSLRFFHENQRFILSLTVLLIWSQGEGKPREGKSGQFLLELVGHVYSDFYLVSKEKWWTHLQAGEQSLRSGEVSFATKSLDELG